MQSPAEVSRRILVVGLIRATLATALIVAAFFLVPLDLLADVPAAVTLPLALAAFVVLVVAQVRAITRSPLPGLRAVEALAVSVPLFLVIFSATYYVMSVADPSWFSEDLSRLDSLYFTVTVFATVGFGDIAADAPPTRTAVTVQMAADLLVIGIGLRVILGAVQHARRRDGRPLPPGD